MYVTAYENTASLGSTEYVFPELQATLTIFNFGLRNIIAIANGQRKIIEPNDSENFKHVNSVFLEALQGSQRFRLEGRKQVEQLVAGTVDSVARETLASIGDSIDALKNSFVDVGNYPSLQTAIDDAKAKGKYVNLNNRIVTISADVKIKDVKVANGTIRFTSQASVVMQGLNPMLESVKIDSQTFGSGSRGHVELVDTNGAILKDVVIVGTNSGKAIYCKTRAHNTYISNVKVEGDIAWGILFNDSEKIQGDGFRTVDGINYNDGPIGEGLFVDNFEFGKGLNNRTGDGLEINCPDFGFNKIRVTNSIVHKANLSSSTGIGFGFAKCKDVRLTTCSAYNCQLDGFHFEKGSEHILVGCYSNGCSRAVSVTHTRSTKIVNSIFVNSEYWLVCYNNGTSAYNPDGFITMEDFTLENCTFDGASLYGVLIGNAKHIKILNNMFRNYNGSASTGVLQFYNVSGTTSTVTDSEIRNNRFIKGTGTTNPTNIIALLNSSSGNIVENNKFEGYSSSSVTLDKTTNRYLSNRNKGTFVSTGDGVFTSVTIPHGLGELPAYYVVQPSNNGSGTAGVKYVANDSTNLTVYFNNPPANGVSVGLRWYAEV
jgi:hypothetical protein